MALIQCRWCSAQNDTSATTCTTCGAPLKVAYLVSDSGWREAPRLRDMTEFHFGQSSCQVDGDVVPVADTKSERLARLALGCPHGDRPTDKTAERRP